MKKTPTQRMKKAPAVTPEAAVIRVNMAKSLIMNRKELAERAGIDPQLLRKRFLNPASIRLYEFRAIISETGMPDEDIIKVVRGE